uniref:Tho2 domain-containing protein n=1 Tax=Syphacia muris TaxID=451379 RepID=A0A158R4A6_9BILA
MEHVLGHKGKRKCLVSKTSCRRDIFDSRVLKAFHERCDLCVREIEESLNVLYEDVVSRISTFVKTEWSNASSDLISTGVFCTGNVEGICLVRRLKEKIGLEPLCLNFQQSELYPIISYLREHEEPKYVLIERFESLPDGFFDALISLMTDDNEIFNVVLLIGLSMNTTSIYSRCSLESYTQLAFTFFDFPSPKSALNAFTDVFTFKIDSEVEIYISLLDFLLFLNKDLFAEGFNRNDLNFLLQEEGFFSNENPIFRSWLSFWLTMDVKEMLRVLRELKKILKDIDSSITVEIKNLENDLLGIDERKEELKKKMQLSTTNKSNSGRRISSKGWQGFRDNKAMLEKSIRERKALDIQSGDQKRFVNLLKKVLSQFLVPFSKMADVEKSLLHASTIVKELCCPNFKLAVEHDISAAVLKDMYPHIDLCLGYRLVQSMAKTHTKILVDEYASLLKHELKEVEKGDLIVRVFCCLGILEFLGIIHCSADKGNLSFQVTLNRSVREEANDGLSPKENLPVNGSNNEVTPSSEITDEDRSILYSPDVQRSAINNLVIFSILIFVIPISSMCLLKKYLFEDYMNCTNSQASLYAGIAAIFVTYSLVAIFAHIAFKEETKLEERFKKKL